MYNNFLLTTSLLLDALRDPYAFAFLVTASVLLIAYFSRRHSVSFFMTVALTFSATHITKSLFKVPRPDVSLIETTGYRFPSLHAAIAGAFFASLWFYAWAHWKSPLARTLTTLLALCAISYVAWSRLYLGVHHPIDVLVGASIGIATSLIVHIFIVRRS